ncbi:hypothetical protein CRG98_032536 [Punica granatum]|uniref:Uncharacterized protein n=1 Tax=Punica granatum TaxID=22663 RepID=A0A2I0ITT8_PUNGR|nr:hypothetical protein CRG98_032536 [Punica granatum]
MEQMFEWVVVDRLGKHEGGGDVELEAYGLVVFGVLVEKEDDDGDNVVVMDMEAMKVRADKLEGEGYRVVGVDCKLVVEMVKTVEADKWVEEDYRLEEVHCRSVVLVVWTVEVDKCVEEDCRPVWVDHKSVVVKMMEADKWVEDCRPVEVDCKLPVVVKTLEADKWVEEKCRVVKVDCESMVNMLEADKWVENDYKPDYRLMVAEKVVVDIWEAKDSILVVMKKVEVDNLAGDNRKSVVEKMEAGKMEEVGVKTVEVDKWVEDYRPVEDHKLAVAEKVVVGIWEVWADNLVGEYREPVVEKVKVEKTEMVVTVKEEAEKSEGSARILAVWTDKLVWEYRKPVVEKVKVDKMEMVVTVKKEAEKSEGSARILAVKREADKLVQAAYILAVEENTLVLEKVAVDKSEHGVASEWADGALALEVAVVETHKMVVVGNWEVWADKLVGEYREPVVEKVKVEKTEMVVTVKEEAEKSEGSARILAEACVLVVDSEHGAASEWADGALALEVVVVETHKMVAKKAMVANIHEAGQGQIAWWGGF